MNPFFSVIIPIYNVSHFIDSGICYVLEQTYNNYEVILVDDGSTDDSGKKCDHLASTHDLIHCFHQKNQGSGPARNLGIKEAKGEYIIFFDIDDKIELNLLQTVNDELQTHNYPDVLMFSYDSYDEKYKKLSPIVFDQLVCNNNDDIKYNFVDHLLGIKKTNGFIWNKAYKRDFIINNKLQFPKLLIQQDEVFNLHVYSNASSLVIIPRILYHYIVYNKGNTRSRYIENRLYIYNQVKDSFIELYNTWGLNDRRMLVYVYKRFFNAIIDTLNFNNTHKSSNLTSKERKQEMKTVIECKETQDCINQLAELKAIPNESFYNCYYKAIKSQNITYYRFIRTIDKSIKSVKWMIKKHLI